MKNKVKLDKKSSQVILILVGIGIPLNYLFFSVVVSTGIFEIDFNRFLKPLIIGFVAFSAFFYIFYPLILRKYQKNQDLEKKLYQDKFMRIFRPTFFSFLGFFLTLITSKMIHSVIGTAISIVLAILIISREKLILNLFSKRLQRLPGITFIGWLHIIIGTVYLYCAIILPSNSSLEHNLITLTIASIIGLTFIMVGIGIGILYLLNFARMLVIIFNSMHAFGNLIGLIGELYEPIGQGPWRMLYLFGCIVINGLIIFYFTRPGVKEKFTAQRES